jgi:hypothetical protein
MPRDLPEEEETPAAPVAIDDEPEFPLVEPDQEEDDHEQGAPEEDVIPVMREPMAPRRSLAGYSRYSRYALSQYSLSRYAQPLAPLSPDTLNLLIRSATRGAASRCTWVHIGRFYYLFLCFYFPRIAAIEVTRRRPNARRLAGSAVGVADGLAIGSLLSE